MIDMGYISKYYEEESNLKKDAALKWIGEVRLLLQKNFWPIDTPEEHGYLADLFKTGYVPRQARDLLLKRRANLRSEPKLEPGVKPEPKQEMKPNELNKQMELF